MHIGYWWESQRKRPLGRPRCMWVESVMTYLGEIGFRGLSGSGFVWLRIGVNVVMNFLVP
jgi:hypothetical protein